MWSFEGHKFLCCTWDTIQKQYAFSRLNIVNPFTIKINLHYRQRISLYLTHNTMYLHQTGQNSLYCTVKTTDVCFENHTEHTCTVWAKKCTDFSVKLGVYIITIMLLRIKSFARSNT